MMTGRGMFAAIGPEICIGSAILVLVFFERFYRVSRHWSRLTALVSILFAMIALVPSLSGPAMVLESVYIADFYTVIFKFVMLSVSLFLIIGARRTQIQTEGSDFHLPLLFGTLGGMISAGSSDLFLLYLSVELTAFSSIFMLMMLKNNLHSHRFFFFNLIGFQVIGSVCLLAGAGCLQIGAHESHYSLIRDALRNVPTAALPVFFIGLLFLLFGLIIKWNVIPAHYYSLRFLPDDAVQFFIWFFLMISASMTAILGRLFAVLQPILNLGLTDIISTISMAILIAGGVAGIGSASSRKFGYFLLAQHGFIVLAALADASPGKAGIRIDSSTHGLLMLATLCIPGIYFLLFPDRIQSQRITTEQSMTNQIGILVLLGTIAGMPFTLGFHARLFTFRWLILDRSTITFCFAFLGYLLIIMLSVQLSAHFSRFIPRNWSVHAIWAERIGLCLFGSLLLGLGLIPAPLIRVFESILHRLV